jgi:hypothetical protein
MRAVTIEFHVIYFFHFIVKWIAVWQKDLHCNRPNCF